MEQRDCGTRFSKRDRLLLPVGSKYRFENIFGHDGTFLNTKLQLQSVDLPVKVMSVVSVELIVSLSCFVLGLDHNLGCKHGFSILPLFSVSMIRRRLPEVVLLLGAAGTNRSLAAVMLTFRTRARFDVCKDTTKKK